MIDHSEHFARQELECRCGCGQCEMSEAFMKHVEQARAMTNFPFEINSGYRCLAYDSSIRGDNNHPKGEALDIHWHNGNELFELIYALGSVGVRRFGISFKDKFLHADMVVEHPQRVIWGY